MTEWFESNQTLIYVVATVAILTVITVYQWARRRTRRQVRQAAMEGRPMIADAGDPDVARQHDSLAMQLQFDASIDRTERVLSAVKAPMLWGRDARTFSSGPELVRLEQTQGGAVLRVVSATNSGGLATSEPEWRRLRERAMKAAAQDGIDARLVPGPKLIASHAVIDGLPQDLWVAPPAQTPSPAVSTPGESARWERLALLLGGDDAVARRVSRVIDDPAAAFADFAADAADRGIEDASGLTPAIALVDALGAVGRAVELDWSTPADEAAAMLDRLVGTSPGALRGSLAATSDRTVGTVLPDFAAALGPFGLLLVSIDIDSDSFPLAIAPASARAELTALVEASDGVRIVAAD
ncbi:hypothetical protein [Agrococcus sp. ARC_14]|uniref:DUF6630 family protein n=1 Tax=Agrococcus sp. ARC_14 TaxID=2919927 RepID=UPI001F05C8F7|nr:hypothetical protein [Agrococcus sp. ARC_14]MCH1881709.1 hypothetical protein [Agrococcus sp. ARC_14]